MDGTDTTASATDTPYVGLNYYTEDRAELFFGREAERATVISNVRVARLTLLYAESGVGKSSLLRAGVASRLRELAHRSLAERGSAGYIPVVFSSWRDEPVEELINEIEGAIGPFVPDEAGVKLPRERLEDAIRAATSATDATLLIILDQFEEYFLYSPREATAGRFANDLAHCLSLSDLRANFLIAVREDAYAGLGDLFEGQLDNVYGNYLHLEYLDREAARTAIVNPLEHYNAAHRGEEPVTIESELVEAVLDQVRTGQVVFEQEGRGVVSGRNGGNEDREEIETPYLQLVMTTLWEHERGVGSRVLRLSTLEELGGAQEIVRTHLDRALGGLPDDEREAAVDVFHHLVTPSGTKIVHRLPDLAAYSSRRPEQVESLVEKLTSGDQRILRPVPAPAGGDGQPRVEIFHDVLAPAILAWRSGQTAARLERERQAAEDRAQRERTRVRVFRTLTAISVMLLIVAVVAVVLALGERSSAINETHKAQSQLVASQAATAFSSGNLPEASLFAAEAYRLSPTVDARRWILTIANSKALGSQLRGHKDSVTSVDFSPDGRTLASGSTDHTVRLWEVTSHRHIAKLTAPGAVNSVAFSPNGRTLASGGADHTVRLWNLATHRQLGAPFAGHTKAVNDVAFSPDGRTLASGDDDHTVRLWELTSHRQIAKLTAPGAVNSVAFSPDGRTLASGGADHTVRLWNLATHRQRGAPLAGHTDSVNDVVFSPDGRTLASASDDHTVRLWDVASHRRLATLIGHIDAVTSVDFSPDGKTLAAGSVDSTILLWSTLTHLQLGTPLTGHTNFVNAVAFSPDGRTLASGSDDETVLLWDPTVRGQFSGSFTGHTKAVRSVAFSPGGRTLASGSADHTIRLWDPATHNLLVKLTAGGAVNSVAFSPDGRTLASGNDDRTILLWDLHTHSQVGTLSGHTKPVDSVAFSPDGRTLASGGADRTVRLWNLATHRQLGAPLAGHTDSVNSVAFSPDGRTLASGSDDDTVRLWDVASHRQLATLTGHTDSVTSVAFRPNGKSLAGGSDDSTILLWNTRTHRQLGTTLTGQNSAVRAVTFSPDGKILAAGYDRGALALWDVPTHRVFDILYGQFAAVNSVAFSADGGTLAAGSGGDPDHRVELWSNDPINHYVRQLCDRYIDLHQARTLWQQTEPSIPYLRPC